MLLPELFYATEENGIVSFDQLERFVDIYGQIELSEYGGRILYSPQKNIHRQ
jgi:hypothetical protein